MRQKFQMIFIVNIEREKLNLKEKIRKKNSDFEELELKTEEYEIDDIISFFPIFYLFSSKL